ncbi:hypothetical protein [Lysobacter sp. cf310]|uniref:hypothetical protein n=1 Tax=Lysobacter sp. cf310 TaxID=1761790 RepID=UPI0008E0F7A7|nr:hypothetical protein [Lysobacter sp. cf310]SFK53808.1 hypothetical protein SAMN04487938_1288 [Lysobacter sp. cf310]
MKITGSWQIAHLSESQRFVLYAGAYLEASRSVCLRMRAEDTENTWPNAAVTMMLAAHAVELFLKGVIHSRDPKALAKIHRIDQLAETYYGLFPEEEFAFDVPFQGDYPGFSEDEIATLKKEEPIPSILFRYPVKSSGVEWQGVHGFEAQGFLELIAELRDVFSRISDRI